jgi:hypothetical protein
MQDSEKKITNSKPIPYIPLSFKGVIANVLKVKPPEKALKIQSRKAGQKGNRAKSLT